jgi:hypothetical protein
MIGTYIPMIDEGDKSELNYIFSSRDSRLLLVAHCYPEAFPQLSRTILAFLHQVLQASY